MAMVILRPSATCLRRIDSALFIPAWRVYSLRMKAVNERVWNERWHLAALDRPDLIKIGLVSVMVGLCYVLFHLLGNTVVDVRSRSVFIWTVARWGDRISFGGADYSHGYLIPFVSLFCLWVKRKELAAAPKAINWAGLVVIAGALVMHWVGAKMQQTRLSLLSLIVLCWGVPFFLLGWQVARRLIFPVSYLIFCVPLNFLDSLTFPLKMNATVLTEAVLNGLGIPAMSEGSKISLIENREISFEVAAACSGLRSLLALTAITAVYAWLTQKGIVRKWILFLSAIPLAVLGNVVRVVTVFLVATAFGPEFAGKIYHDFSGYIVFAVAVIAMVGISSVLQVNFREVWKRWKEHLMSPTS